MKSLQDINVCNKTVLVRVDFNVPMKDGVITDDTRIIAVLPTLKTLLEQQAKVLVVSHLGRPTPGENNSKFTLLPVANRLRQLLNHPVRFEADWLYGVNCTSGEVVVCENVRNIIGEVENSPEVAKQLASLSDIFVMDAFACAHRAHASTEGIAHFVPIAVAGPLLMQEINILDKILNKPKRPILAIVGGSKVSSKITILEQLCKKVDAMIVGGGIANTFLMAKGCNVGNSLYEPAFIDVAKKMLESENCEILLPKDVVVAEEITENALAVTKEIIDVGNNEKILDIGPQTIELYIKHIQQTNTILWNGPVGVFEYSSFANGTQMLAEAIAKSNAFSVAGGGDTIAAIKQFKLAEGISYISTGGGAFLEYIEGKSLPGIVVLQEIGI